MELLTRNTQNQNTEAEAALAELEIEFLEAREALVHAKEQHAIAKAALVDFAGGDPLYGAYLVIRPQTRRGNVDIRGLVMRATGMTNPQEIAAFIDEHRGASKTSWTVRLGAVQ